MGAFLLAAGAKGKRYALPHARILIHQPLGGFSGQATDIDIHAKEILRTRDKLNELLVKHTGQPHRAHQARHRARLLHERRRVEGVRAHRRGARAEGARHRQVAAAEVRLRRWGPTSSDARHVTNDGARPYGARRESFRARVRSARRREYRRWLRRLRDRGKGNAAARGPDLPARLCATIVERELSNKIVVDVSAPEGASLHNAWIAEPGVAPCRGDVHSTPSASTRASADTGRSLGSGGAPSAGVHAGRYQRDLAGSRRALSLRRLSACACHSKPSRPMEAPLGMVAVAERWLGLVRCCVLASVAIAVGCTGVHRYRPATPVSSPPPAPRRWSSTSSRAATGWSSSSPTRSSRTRARRYGCVALAARGPRHHARHPGGPGGGAVHPRVGRRGHRRRRADTLGPTRRSWPQPRDHVRVSRSGGARDRAARPRRRGDRRGGRDVRSPSDRGPRPALRRGTGRSPSARSRASQALLRVARSRPFRIDAAVGRWFGPLRLTLRLGISGGTPG